MKTSNKILTGGFVFVVICMIAANIVAKNYINNYKTNNPIEESADSTKHEGRIRIQIN